VLALAPAAAAQAAVVPDAGDTRDAAQAVESLPAGATALVDHPGDHDWYSIAGRRPDDAVSTVFVRVLSATGCDVLSISLFNPEGRWMRTSRARPGDVATVLVPGMPSRYELDVRAVNDTCAGVEYELTYVLTDRPLPDDRAGRCLVARSNRAEAQRRLHTLELRRARVTAAARPRYDAYVARAKRTLANARRDERRICRKRG